MISFKNPVLQPLVYNFCATMPTERTSASDLDYFQKISEFHQYENYLL